MFELEDGVYQREKPYSSSAPVPARNLYDGFSQGGPEEIIKVVDAGGDVVFQLIRDWAFPNPSSDETWHSTSKHHSLHTTFELG